MAQIIAITQLDQWQEIWARASAQDAPPALVFKRSPICPTSHAAESIFNDFIKHLPKQSTLAVYSVDVIGARPASQRIAADTKVRHESPQALLIEGGRVIWHASHGDIDHSSLQEHVSSL
ncbi:MAG TPA: bacillithiol system redox-active protein YtxJ [Planctomycetota bacterium]|nr:bacillithiol system redox-active protein YtxJ [Planctomycetota bacterium]